MNEVNRAQRALNQTLSRNLRLVGQGGPSGAALAVLGVAFLYGVLHAVGPGHGKAVIAAFFVGREARLSRAVTASFGLSLLQMVTSIGLVALLALLLGQRGFDVTARAVWVEIVSYGLVALIGLSMVVRTVRQGGRHDECGSEPGSPAPGGRRDAARLLVAAGLTPCPSGIILLLFALANGVFAFGVGASLVMALGMGITVALVGLATIGVRRAMLRPLSSGSSAFHWATRGLALGGSLGLTAVGSLFLASALTRLP